MFRVYRYNKDSVSAAGKSGEHIRRTEERPERQQAAERQRAAESRRTERRLRQKRRIIRQAYRRDWRQVAELQLASLELLNDLNTAYRWTTPEGEEVRIHPAAIIRKRWRRLTGQSPSREDIDSVINTTALLMLERPLIVDCRLSEDDRDVRCEESGKTYREQEYIETGTRPREFRRTLLGQIRSHVAMVRLNLPQNQDVPEFATIRSEHVALTEALGKCGNPRLEKLAEILKDGNRMKRKREAEKLGISVNVQTGDFAIIDEFKFAAWEAERCEVIDNVEILTSGKARPKRLATRATLDERLKTALAYYHN